MELRDIAINKLKARGVEISDISPIVYELQKKYSNDLTNEKCEEAILKVLEKKEVVYTILTGIAIDELAEQGHLNDIGKIINNDEPLYGIDEILALSIINIHGSIALTNFGYLDKVKPGIIGKIDQLSKEGKVCHTFLDDIICAIVSSAASRIAHENKKKFNFL